jgi:uncharacterized repeat protein (TIGR01451 family)
VFVSDTVAHTTRRVSVGSNGEQGDLDSFGPAVDSDGQVIAFTSDSSTFVSETQTFFANDVFVRDARPPADLALGLVDSPDPATVRGTLTYTATTTNGGPTNATGVTLVGALPANTTFVSASSDVHPGGQGQDRRHDHVPGRQPERRRLGNGADRRAADSYRDADLLAQGLRRPAGPETARTTAARPRRPSTSKSGLTTVGPDTGPHRARASFTLRPGLSRVRGCAGEAVRVRWTWLTRTRVCSG